MKVKCPKCYGDMMAAYRGTGASITELMYCFACNFETDQMNPCPACDSVHIGWECPNAHGVGV